MGHLGSCMWKKVETKIVGALIGSLGTWFRIDEFPDAWNIFPLQTNQL